MNRLVRHFLWLVLLCCAGCADDDLDPRYGESSGEGATAVNGLKVLVDLFSQAGHKVSTSVSLSPRVHDSADVIVWAPNDYQPPSDEARQWFQDWMADGLDRVLIYIGRDYDAVPEYWDAILQTVPANSPDAVDMRARSFAARAAQALRRSATSKPAATATGNANTALPPPSPWFTFDHQLKPRHSDTLDGPWAAGIDPQRSAVKLLSRFTPPDDYDYETLLESKGDLLACRVESLDGQIIVVTNGSFLLNLPLVNHEHRKLAGRLIDEISPHSEIIFLESGPGGPNIREDDEPAMRTGLEIFAIEPFNVILLHLAVVGLIFCFAKLPIFGLPRSGQAGSGADFGAHIAALGNLLKRTRGADFARERIQVYYARTQSKPTTPVTPTPPHDDPA